MMRSLLLTLAITAFSFAASAQNKLWADIQQESTRSYTDTRRETLPSHFRMLQLNKSVLAQLQKLAPMRNPSGKSVQSTVQFDIPLPEGGSNPGSFTEAPILSEKLQIIYKDIKTYQLSDPVTKNSLGRLTVTPLGVSGIIFTDKGTVYLSPLGKEYGDLHMVYYVKDLPAHKPITCGVKGDDIADLKPASNLSTTAGDCQLRTYRIAVAATGEYTTWAGGTQPAAMATITSTINDVTAIYERDADITFTLVTDNTIIFTNAGTDPYATVAFPDPTTTLDVNHTTINTNIGAGNYDLGIVFNNGWDGGLAQRPSVCNAAGKGRAAAGLTFGNGAIATAGPQGPIFDGTVAHEMGHQFNAQHTHGATTGSCGGGNSSPATAWEPGGGNTIMAYAGSCGALAYQVTSDLYFHAGTIGQIVPYAVGTATCSVNTSTGNNAPNVTASGAAFTIPISTPFTLSSTATDADNNTLTYTWEQLNAGTSGTAPVSTNLTGPNFRSYAPSTSSNRTLPRMEDLVAGTATPYEVLPSVGRTLNFRVTVRDNAAGGGCTDEDNVAVTTTATSGPFTVTSQAAPVTYAAGTVQAVTWNVAGTTGAPVSCANVDILLSIDGGATYPYVLVSNTANDGTENVTIPSLPTVVGRIKVQANGNIFFNINTANITITSTCAAEGATVTPSTNVTGNAGNAALDLSLSPNYGALITPITGTLATSDPVGYLTGKNTGPGTCIVFNGNASRYDTYTFTVNVAGNYTFARSGGTSGNVIYNIYTGSFNQQDPCTNFMNSPFQNSPASISPSYTVSLSPGVFYTLVVGTFSASAPALPANYTINVTPPGGGGLYSAIASPGAGFNYTYVIVNNGTGNIVGIDASSNMSNGTTYPMGTYTIYGLSYSNTILPATLNAYIGGPLTTLQNDALYNPGVFCGNFSKNTVAVNVLNSLPVTLLPLTATKMNSTVLLKWGTASEQNTSHFEILGSADGINFRRVVGTVPAHGNSDKAIQYELTDNNPEPAINYYRVKEVDLDGRTTLGNIVSINMAQAYVSSNVYPNPAKSIITLEYVTQQRGKIDVLVSDIKGAVVARYQFSAEPGRNVQTFNVAKLAKGVYTIRSVSGSETMISRFVKE